MSSLRISHQNRAIGTSTGAAASARPEPADENTGFAAALGAAGVAASKQSGTSSGGGTGDAFNGPLVPRRRGEGQREIGDTASTADNPVGGLSLETSGDTAALALDGSAATADGSSLQRTRAGERGDAATTLVAQGSVLPLVRSGDTGAVDASSSSAVPSGSTLPSKQFAEGTASALTAGQFLAANNLPSNAPTVAADRGQAVAPDPIAGDAKSTGGSALPASLLPSAGSAADASLATAPTSWHTAAAHPTPPAASATPSADSSGATTGSQALADAGTSAISAAAASSPASLPNAAPADGAPDTGMAADATTDPGASPRPGPAASNPRSLDAPQALPTLLVGLSQTQTLPSSGTGVPGSGVGAFGDGERRRFAPIAAASDADQYDSRHRHWDQRRYERARCREALAPAGADPSAGAPISDQVAGHLIRLVSSGSREMVMRLHPAELGDVTVRVAVSGHDVSAWFTSSQPQVQSAISAALGQLQADLGNAGYNLNGAWVGADASNAQQQGSNLPPPPTRPTIAASAIALPSAAAAARPVSSGLNIYV